jgi:hypothetical protein
MPAMRIFEAIYDKFRVDICKDDDKVLITGTSGIP